jgi:hypothetical protein
MESMCRAEGLPNPHVVIRDFRDKAKANEYRYADWEAAFRTWMRSEITARAYQDRSWLAPQSAQDAPQSTFRDPDVGPDGLPFIPAPQAALDALAKLTERKPDPELEEWLKGPFDPPGAVNDEDGEAA